VIRRRTTPFTLIELVVVMLLLTTLIAIIAPRLTGFFRGRRLDADARRLWALTRYAREEAITRAIPVRVWFSPEEHRYGVDAVPGYGYTVDARTYELDRAIVLTVEPLPVGTTAADTVMLTWWPDGTLADGAADALVLQDGDNSTDAWRLMRNPRLSTFTLERGGGP
jgi:type II secretion system protein H